MTRLVAWYQARDVARSRWLVAYTLFFALVTEALLRFAGGGARTILSLASVMLYVVPLVTLVFGTISFYNARELIELLLAQPVPRGVLYRGLYLGLAAPLALAVVAGIGTPFVLRGFGETGQGSTLAALLLVSVALSAICSAAAFCIALWSDDRLKGLAAAIGVWLLGAIVYDGLVLAVVAAFADYPLERPMLALMLANPIDLARVTLLLQLDVSALMGYTGAVFQQFLGGIVGTLVAAGALIVWFAVPVALGARTFRHKDF
ncbi:MAG TPA: ABC transporter permease subunit [Gemmatimonadaceae bacterium]|nr:ABC transporter permease subunit [Gemmatimonadaceae bacterium]